MVPDRRNYWQRIRWGHALHLATVYVLLALGSLVIMLPFFWMITTSLKRPGTEFTFPIEWLPNPPRWENYREKLFHTLHAIKTESGSMDKAGRVGMLALFQNEVGYSHGQIVTSLVPRPSHM